MRKGQSAPQQQPIDESGESGLGPGAKRSVPPSASVNSSLYSGKPISAAGQSSAAANQQGPTARLSMDSNKAMSQSSKPYSMANKKMDSQQSLTNSETASSSRASSRDTSARQSRDNSVSASVDPSQSDPNKSKKISYTIEEIERKALNTVEEYIQNKDVSEALKDFDDFRPSDQAQHVLFMEQIIHKVLERNENSRQSIGSLFYNAIKHKKLDINNFVQSLKNVLEFAEEMAIDVPKIATYLSQIVAPLFQKDISVEFLLEACEPIRDKKICAEFIAEALHCASNKLGHTAVAEIFKGSNLRIHDFLAGVKSQPEFIKENVRFPFEPNGFQFF